MADSAPTVKKKRKITQKRRELDRLRNKTRVNLGMAFERWRELRDRLSQTMEMSSDAQLGMYLLDRYVYFILFYFTQHIVT